MKFSQVQNEAFGAIRGSYSILTKTEFGDSQLTATDAETKLLESYFKAKGDQIYVGNVKSSNGAAGKVFKLYPKGDEIVLNLVYPKPEKSELRLYLKKTAGYKPNAGDVWFLYETCEHELWIGSLSEKEWREKSSGVVFKQVSEDEFADVPPPVQQDLLLEDEKLSMDSKRQKRDPALVKKRLELSKYKCEYDKSHKLFVARASGCRYVEGHHIIPVHFQPQFFVHKKSLDNLQNICSLCPWCHRAIHHAEEDLVRKMLSSLFDLRSIGVHYAISKQDLFQMYAVEEIVRNDDEYAG